MNLENRCRLVVDAMAATVPMRHIVQAAFELKEQGLLPICLVGDEVRLREAVRLAGIDSSVFDVLHAPNWINGRENGGRAIKVRPNSSLQLGHDLALSERSIFVSFGNASALRELVRQSSSDRRRVRPLAGQRRIAGRVVTITDVGPFVYTTGSQLTQFGIAAAALHRITELKERPSVGLLSSALSISDCSDQIREAHMGLNETCPSYVGLIDGRQLRSDPPDVVVTDAESGNILYHFLGETQSFRSNEEGPTRSFLWRRRGVRSNHGPKNLRPKVNGGVVLGSEMLVVHQSEAASETAVRQTLFDAVHLQTLGISDEMKRLALDESDSSNRVTSEYVPVNSN